MRAMRHEINWTPVKSEGVNFRVYVSLSLAFIRFNNAWPDEISAALDRRTRHRFITASLARG